MNDALFTPACGAFGEFGGMFVPEALVPPLEQLAAAYEDALRDPAFRAELDGLLGEYAGRPTPLYRCRNLTAGTPVRLYLKREDLLHGGAHAINQVLGQALLARRMGKTRLLADTGAGPHGVAAAFAGALFGLETVIYMGARDVARHGADVARMRVMGAAVVPVDAGAASLKDAVGEALRDWIASHERSHYVLGTAAGPHPFPTLVRDLQQVIGREARAQVLAREGRLPSAVIACVGGGSNAIGLFGGFLADPDVELVGVEASRPGLAPGASGAAITEGAIGVLHGARTRVRLDADGQVATSRSISAGLDYPALGPEHAYLAVTGRARYARATGAEALAAFHALARREGILPALESAHALSYALRRAREAATAEVLIVNLSGRGDKDLPYVQELLENSDAL